MRTLVTGAAGFLGSHLTGELLRAGHTVVALDDLSTGHRSNLPRGVRWVCGDVRDAAVVEPLVAGAERVFHLAAAVGPRLLAEDPADTWSRNVEGSAVVLRACAARGVRVLLTSSSEVYGPDRGGPGSMRESDPVQLDPAGRRDLYALSKLSGEAYALALARAEGLEVVIARLFNVVGPRQSSRYGMVLARFAAAALAGRPLTVYGDGSQRRCFLHVLDAVAALRLLAESSDALGRTVNVGSREEVTILDLARRVLAATGSTAGLRHVPFARIYGEGFVDPPRRRPDLHRLQAWTSWRPQRVIDDAIHDVLASCAPTCVLPRP